MDDTERSLLEFLDSSQLTCLNESRDHNMRSIVSKDSSGRSSTAFLESDVDEQLLLNITFNQAVRARTLLVRSSAGAQAPRKIKLFINQPSLGFDDIEDGRAVPAQEFELSEDDVSQGKKIALRYVRFQAVNSLHIFVESNQGGEELTRIDSIDVFGFPVMGIRDLSGLRQQEE